MAPGAESLTIKSRWNLLAATNICLTCVWSWGVFRRERRVRAGSRVFESWSPKDERLDGLETGLERNWIRILFQGRRNSGRPFLLCSLASSSGAPRLLPSVDFGEGVRRQKGEFESPIFPPILALGLTFSKRAQHGLTSHSAPSCTFQNSREVCTKFFFRQLPSSYVEHAWGFRTH